MLKMYLLLLMSSFIFLTNSCITTQPVTTNGKCPPDGYFLIKKDSLINLIESCARTKSELNECLERERK